MTVGLVAECTIIFWGVSVRQDDDKRRGGITLARYQELYALYLGNPDEKNAGVYLFGPLNAGD